MKIKIQGFSGVNHSWATIHWALAREWKKLGHVVEIFSTDGLEHLPADLKENIIGYKKWADNASNKAPAPIIGKIPTGEYDMQFSYTAMKNARNYLFNGTKNRFNQWCYEWISDDNKNILPEGFATSHKYCDKLLAPSTWVKDYMFLPAGIPEEKIVVVPHGIDVDEFRKDKDVDFSTNKKFKFLFNVTQTHLRKNIRGLLSAYGGAFNSSDNVTLIIKTKDKKPILPFEVSINDEIKRFKKKFSNAPEVKVYSEFLDNISELYTNVDCVVSLAHGEGFNMVFLEALAKGKLVVGTEFGPHRDFLDDSNALLVKSSIVKTDRKSMYWGANPNAKWVLPDEEDAVLKLREAYETASERNKALELNRENVYKQYNWNKIAQQIIDLCV